MHKYVYWVGVGDGEKIWLEKEPVKRFIVAVETMW